METDLDERVIEVKRVARKTKGGNAISFSALTVVGDRKGKVGIGFGKAPDVRGAIQKSFRYARQDMTPVPLQEGTIPHWVEARHKAAHLLLKPAPPGTGVIAGASIRPIVEVVGIRNIVSKVIGSKSKLNNAKATIKALKILKGPEDRRTPTKKTSRSLGDLSLPKRVLDVLKKAGIKTVGELKQKDLTEIPGVGPKTAERIKEAVAG
jgi:small subunit ribosomal protein S5